MAWVNAIALVLGIATCTGLVYLSIEAFTRRPDDEG